MDYSDLMLDINCASQCLIKLFPPKVEEHCVDEQGPSREEKRCQTATPTTPRLEVPPATLGFSRIATPFPAFEPRSCTLGPSANRIPYRFERTLIISSFHGTVVFTHVWRGLVIREASFTSMGSNCVPGTEHTISAPPSLNFCVLIDSGRGLA